MTFKDETIHSVRGRFATGLLVTTFFMSLSGCGGGGGSSAPVAPTVPTITLPAAASAYATNNVSFTASSSDPGGLALSYSWNFGDGTASASGATVTHNYATPGTYKVQVTVTNTANLSATASADFTAQSSAPSKPEVAIKSATSLYTYTAVSMTAASTDPLGRNLGYTWDFGDGETGTGATVSHTYKTPGNFTVTATATNTSSQAAASSQQITVANPISGMTIGKNIETPYAGQQLKLTGAATNATNQALSYKWDFGDGTTVTGAKVNHVYATEGTYTVKLTAQDTAGSNAATTQQVTVLSSANNVLTVDCGGSNCGATSANKYSGSGVGTWRYANATNKPALVNINIDGVKEGQTATLVFSNPGTATVTDTPSGGAAASPALAANRATGRTPRQFPEMLVDPVTEAHGHDALLKQNRALGQLLRQQAAASTRSTAQVAREVPPAPRPAPAVGTTRTWKDTFTSRTAPPPYATAVAASCTLPSGRNLVFWLDPNATSAGNVTSADISEMQASVCGASGGFDRLKALLGDVWGSAAKQYSQLIQDGTSLQDINIAIVNAPEKTGWAGYFTGLNNFVRTAGGDFAGSNEALVFFINASQVKVSRSYVIATLLHELTHMTNFYQRSVARDTLHETWLEETTAMMTEDIVSPVVNAGYNPGASYRIPTYLSTGGGVSYINWPELSSNNYAMGGSFGVYLNRRYGLSLYQQLVTDCQDGYTSNDSHACLDSLIKANGGIGFADEFAHFGAAMFAPLSIGKMIERYGFPAANDGGYTMGAVDVTQAATNGPVQPFVTNASAGFTATTHVYTVDTIAAGKTNYVRNNVSVPPGTTLLLVIR